MNNRHIHADFIIAWANGATIQVKDPHYDLWNTTDYPKWHSYLQYRIKPKKKSPGQVYFEGAYPKIPFDKQLHSKDNYEKGAIAVIEAYKKGEFDENCNC